MYTSKRYDKKLFYDFQTHFGFFSCYVCVSIDQYIVLVSGNPPIRVTIILKRISNKILYFFNVTFFYSSIHVVQASLWIVYSIKWSGKCKLGYILNELLSRQNIGQVVLLCRSECQYKTSNGAGTKFTHKIH